MQKIINIKRLLWTIFFVLIVTVFGFFLWIQSQYVVPILMYHHISMGNTKLLPTLGIHRHKIKLLSNTVSPENFDQQMRYLKENGYTVISLDDYVKMNIHGRHFSHKTVLITFDDGYVDNYTYAFPILKKYHFPATVFVITDLIGRVPELLNWQQVKEMSGYGILFGSHTRHHLYLPSQSQQTIKDEIIGSKHVLEEHLGKVVDYLAYPCGGFSESIKAVTALAGYTAALTTNRGTDRYDIDLYEINRIHINNNDNSFVFWSKLSGFYNLFRPLKSSH